MALVLTVRWSGTAIDATIRELLDGAHIGSGRSLHPEDHRLHPDPEHWVDASARAVRLAAASCSAGGRSIGDLVRIEVGTAVSTDDHPGGLLALGTDNELVHPPLLATAPGTTASSTADLLALLDHSAPEAWNSASRFTTPSGWLLERFGADPAIGIDEARHSELLDPRRPDHWDLDRLARIDPGRDWLSALPPIVGTSTPIGLLVAEIAERFGVREALPLHAAASPTR